VVTYKAPYSLGLSKVFDDTAESQVQAARELATGTTHRYNHVQTFEFTIENDVRMCIKIVNLTIVHT